MAESHPPDQPPAGASSPPGAERSGPPQKQRNTALWPWLMLLVAAVLGILVGTTLGLRNTSLFPGQAAQTVARPTIVIGNAASPSPLGGAVAPSPSPVGSPVAQAPGASDQATQDYVVQAGDTMRTIAQQVYGDPELWRRIYDANRDVIGSDPDNVQVGMHLKIPPRD